MNSIKYRSEIDGLRAIAIIPVVLYHAGLEAMSGGFIGVDIFFVISGYLISKIIIREISQGQFTFPGFYERRVRRIIPALLAVIFAVQIFSVVIALPAQAVDVARSSLAALFSVSNIYFWLQSGYFAPATEFMPMLHTWSLGVEEQFYLLFPVALVLVSKTRISFKLLFTLTLAPLLIFSIYLSYEKPSVAFYLLPARAWELALGAFIAANAAPSIKSPLVREALSVLGLIMILSALFFIDSGLVFPGWAALFPCLGTALIIQYSENGVLVQRLLSTRFFVFFGLISYSLYLWHWPVFSFSRMLHADLSMSFTQSVISVGIAVVLAYLSWRYVETPFRKKKQVPIRQLVYALSASSMAILIFSLIILKDDGFPSRLDDDALQMLSFAADIDPLREKCRSLNESERWEGCSFGDVSEEISFVLLGDSHAGAIRPALDQISRLEGKRGGVWWRGGCPFLPGAVVVPDADAVECTAFKTEAIGKLRQSSHIKLVILHALWAPAITGVDLEIGGSYRTYLHDDNSQELSEEESLKVFERSIHRAVQEITNLDMDVVIIGGTPEAGFDVPTILALSKLHEIDRPTSIDLEAFSSQQLRVDSIFERIASGYPQVKYISIWDRFCETDCPLLANGKSLFTDGDHLTYSTASEFVGPLLSEQFNSLELLHFE